MENDTDAAVDLDTTSAYTALGLYGVLGIAVITANTMVLLLVYKKPNLRTVTNNFLVSLAVSDLSTGLAAIPSSIACSLTISENTCIAMDMCVRFLAFSSVTHLTVLTVERYLRITRPFVYRTHVTGAGTYRVIGGMWGFSMIASLVQLSWIKSSAIDGEDMLKIEIIYDCVSFVIVVVIPFFLISTIYIAIFRFIRKHNRRRSEVLARSSNKTRSKRANAKNEKKLLLVFLAMIVVFILGSSMYFFWTLLFDLYEHHSIRLTAKTLDICVKFTMFFRYSSSLCNPVLLTFFKQDFHEALKSVFGR